MIQAAVVLVAALSAAELEQSGIDAMYNLRFEAAKKTFATLSETSPDSPAGPYYEAAVLWMEELTRRGGMSGATFRSSRFWSRKKREEAPDGFREALFGRIEETIRRADARLETDRRDTEALYFKGFAESIVAAYYVALEQSFYEAYRSGKRAKALHEQVLEIDPDYADACLIPGVFQYTVATLPRSVRFLAFLMGVRGGKDDGLRLIERAADEGARSRWAGRLALGVIYSMERRHGDAIRVLEELEDTFPDNPMYVLERGSAYILKRDWIAARAVFREMLGQQRIGGSGYSMIDRGLIELRLGEAYLFPRDAREAESWFTTAIDRDDAPERVLAALLLRRGMSRDRLRRRDDAKGDYEKVLELDVDDAINRTAKRYIKKPYR